MAKQQQQQQRQRQWQQAAKCIVMRRLERATKVKFHISTQAAFNRTQRVHIRLFCAYQNEILFQSFECAARSYCAFGIFCCCCCLLLLFIVAFYRAMVVAAAVAAVAVVDFHSDRLDSSLVVEHKLFAQCFVLSAVISIYLIYTYHMYTTLSLCTRSYVFRFGFCFFLSSCDFVLFVSFFSYKWSSDR